VIFAGQGNMRPLLSVEQKTVAFLLNLLKFFEKPVTDSKL
jgi:hypothetical protein